jgi:hypothetical protein
MAEKKISELTAKGATVADTDLMVISEVSGASYVTKRVTGANVKALVTDANMTTSDITTNDVSTSKHGFAPKAPNDTAKFLRGDGTWAVPAGGGGLTTFVEAENSAAPNATVPVDSLSASGAATNIDVAIVPKGEGALITRVPDNTGTNGNKRGKWAVDLQLRRNINTQIASGESSTLLGGYNSLASGQYSIAAQNSSNSTNVNTIAFQSGSATGVAAIAFGGTASGAYSFTQGESCISSAYSGIAMGRQSTASGTHTLAVGYQSVASADGAMAIGYQTTANGQYSLSTGIDSSTFSVRARSSHSSGRIAVVGDAQKSLFVLKRRTTDATATTLTADNVSASTTNQVILSNQSAYRFKGSIVGKQSGSVNASVWDVDGFIVRGANAAATTLNVSNVTLVQNTPAWGTPTLAADTTNGGLQVQVIGAAATNIQWTCTIETTEVIYA